jgi:hypothetical protein
MALVAVQPQAAAALHSSSRITSLSSTEVENEIRGDNQKKSHLEIQGQPMMKEILENKYKLPVWY